MEVFFCLGKSQVRGVRRDFIDRDFGVFVFIPCWRGGAFAVWGGEKIFFDVSRFRQQVFDVEERSGEGVKNAKEDGIVAEDLHEVNLGGVSVSFGEFFVNSAGHFVVT